MKTFFFLLLTLTLSGCGGGDPNFRPWIPFPLMQETSPATKPEDAWRVKPPPK